MTLPLLLLLAVPGTRAAVAPGKGEQPGCYVDSVSARLYPHQVCLVTGGCAHLSHEWCGAWLRCSAQ
jgi:hypothetical protein